MLALEIITFFYLLIFYLVKDPEENYLYKGCECSEFLAMQHRTIPHYTEEYARQKGLLWETAGSWKGNYSYDPNQDDEPCRKAS